MWTLKVTDCTVMDIVRHWPRASITSVSALAILWGEIYIISQKKESRFKLMKFQFIIILEIVLAFLSALLLKWSQDFPILKGLRLKPLRFFYASLFVIICTLSHLALLHILLPQSPEPKLFIMVAWCCFGIYVQYLFCALIMTLLWTIYLQTCSFLHRPILDNQPFTNARAVVAFIYTVVLSGLSIHGGMQLPIIKEVEIQLGPKLPVSMDGMVLAQLSDIHLGPISGLSRLRNIVNLTNGINADVVIVNGDLVDGSVQELGLAVQHLGQIRSKQGVFFTTGNHEYISGGVDELLSFLRSHGITPLHNSHIQLNRTNQEASKSGSKRKKQKNRDFLWLVGVDDVFADWINYGSHGFHLEAAVNGTDDDRVRILVAHQPKAAVKALNSRHHFDLILCGHTHGGQYFPHNVILWMENPFFKGLYQNLGPHENSQVYVSEGTVFGEIPFRLGSSMEITKIILRQ